jgi:hypothetical protein
MLGLSTVKISAKSVRSIEQPSAAAGRGLGAMALNQEIKFIEMIIVYNFSNQSKISFQYFKFFFSFKLSFHSTNYFINSSKSIFLFFYYDRNYLH